MLPSKYQYLLHQALRMRLPLNYIKQFGHFQRNARLYLISNVLSGVTTGIILVLYNLYLASLGYGTDFIGLVLFVVTIGAGVNIFPPGCLHFSFLWRILFSLLRLVLWPAPVRANSLF